MNLQRFRDHADRVVAVALVVLGFVVLTLGWFGVSATGLTSEQMPFIVSGGLGGICVVAVGTALWLSADLRDEWTKLDRIERVLRDNWGAVQLTGGAGDTESPPPAAESSSEDSAGVSASEIDRTHEVADKTVELSAVGARNGDSPASS